MKIFFPLFCNRQIQGKDVQPGARKSCRFPLVIAVILASVPGPLHAQEAAVEIALHEALQDGCTSCGCRVVGTLQPGESRQWWVAFGLVESSEPGGWRRRGPQAVSYCGVGRFKSVKKSFHEFRGIPYAFADVSVVLGPEPAKSRDLAFQWQISSLDRFTQAGKPRYSRRSLEAESRPPGPWVSIASVAPADLRLEQQFNVIEVLASATIEWTTAGDSTFGSLSVFADMPGAEIYLDGGLLGRVSEGKDVKFAAIPAGQRTVEIRDFSGRTARQAINVTPGQESRVEFDLVEEGQVLKSSGFVPLTPNPQEATELWRQRDGAIVVVIPAGEFQMGSNSPGSADEEAPLHTVYLDEYWIDKTEVTWRQFEKFSDATGTPLPAEPAWGRLQHYALSATTWDDAQAYCQWVGGRLPTEAEWEKAARGADGRRYPWGNDWDPTRCNSISGGMHRPEPVGSFHRCVSPYGVLDMIGSHWQWVADYYAPDYYAAAPARNPQGPESGHARGKRGGYWMSHPQQLHVTRRGRSDPEWRNFSHGFRCAHDGGADNQ